MSDPNEELAKKIAERLVREKLLDEVEVKKIVPPLTTGKLRQEDWQIAFENTLERSEKENAK